MKHKQNFHEVVKEKLNASIRHAARNKDSFVLNPGRDFTRNRKLPFEAVINLLLGMGGNSLGKELLEHFCFSTATPTTSAFVQQRKKLSPEVFRFIHTHFMSSFSNWKTFMGYRLVAVDGSTLQIATDKTDLNTHVSSTGPNGANFLHLNALYDLVNKTYLDSITQVIHQKNEFKAITQMIDRSKIKQKVILIADRGYESYNIFAHAQENGWKYLIRIKEPGPRNGIASKLRLPVEEEFSSEHIIRMTRKQTKVIKSQPLLYRYLTKRSTFDYLPPGSQGFYELSFRIVSVQLETGKFQYFITNLDPQLFSGEKIKALYKMRWGIETSFRDLKHTLALNSFHSIKAELCRQEILARMIMYNFCEMITLRVIINKKDRKHTYQANFTMAIHICKQLFKTLADEHPPDVETLIAKHILPIRDGRTHPRNIRYRAFVSFNYRVA